MQVVLVLILVVLGLTTIFQAGVTFFILGRQKQFNQRLANLAKQANGIASHANQYAKEAADEAISRRKAAFDEQERRVKQQVDQAQRLLDEIHEEKVVLTKVIMELVDLIRDFRRDLKEATDGNKP